MPPFLRVEALRGAAETRLALIEVSTHRARVLTQLNEDATHRFGMEKRYARPVRTEPGRGIDQFDTGRFEAGELGVDTVTEMMQPRPAFGEEAGERRVVVRWSEELKKSVWESNESDFDPLSSDDFARFQGEAEPFSVFIECIVQICNRDTDVVEW
jgi:hypothetical protein